MAPTMGDMDTDPILALKRQLAAEIVELSDRVPLIVAAHRLGIDQSRVCDLRKGRVERFSLERLIRLLGKIDRSVTLEVVRDQPGKINWTPKLTEWRRNFPLAKLRMAEAEYRRAGNRELERRLQAQGRGYPGPASPSADDVDEYLDDDPR